MSKQRNLNSSHKYKDTNWFKSHLIYLVCLILLVTITYANALFNAYVIDDIALFLESGIVGDIRSVITQPFLFLRPLIQFIAIYVGGNYPHVFRIVNIVFHIGSTIVFLQSF